MEELKIETLKSYLLLTATGATLILTKNDLMKDRESLKMLAVEGQDKFVAYEVPIGSVKSSYSAHFEHVLSDPKQKNGLIVLDDDGRQVFRNIGFKELGTPIYYEAA